MSRKRQWGEDSTVKIDLSEGASVTMAFKGNLFDLTNPERALISALSSVIQQYREKGETDEDAKTSVQGFHASG